MLFVVQSPKRRRNCEPFAGLFAQKLRPINDDRERRLHGLIDEEALAICGDIEVARDIRPERGLEERLLTTESIEGLPLQRLQVRQHSPGVVLGHPKRRHRRIRRAARSRDAGGEEPDKLFVSSWRRAGQSRFSLCPHRRIVRRTHCDGAAHQPMRMVRVALSISLGVALLAHRHGFDDVAASLNLR